MSVSYDTTTPGSISIQETDLQTYPVEFLRKPTLAFDGKEVCLFIAFVPKGRLLPGAIAMVQALAASGVAVLVCAAVEDMGASLDLAGLDCAAAVIKRRNGGYDFAAWSAVLGSLPELWSAERLFFVNDSILGPLHGLDALLAKIRSSDADFVALTESYEIRHHSQSYFFVFQKAALVSDAIRAFWREVQVEKTKSDVIQKYEVALLERVRDIAGLTAEILFSLDSLFPGVDCSRIRKINPTIHLWEHLINCGFPFLKAELLYANPLRAPIEHWPQIVSLHGGNVAVFSAHVVEMSKTRGRQSTRKRFGNWKLMRWILGDERFFQICETWSTERNLP